MISRFFLNLIDRIADIEKSARLMITINAIITVVENAPNFGKISVVIPKIKLPVSSRVRIRVSVIVYN